jgi:NADPH:quinone reductase-like Zn-dependent oxidoreductase
MATPRDTRLAIWERLAGDLKPKQLDRIAHETVAFDDLPGVFPRFLKGEITGRIVVRIA